MRDSSLEGKRRDTYTSCELGITDRDTASADQAYRDTPLSSTNNHQTDDT